MRWTEWRLISLAMAVVVVACSGSGGLDGQTTSPVIEPGDHRSAPDGGTGSDGGTNQRRSEWPPPSIELKNTPGWQFFGPQHGGPGQVFGVTSDGNGNIWVAGGHHGLFLLPPGATEFKRFTMADGLNGYTDATGPHGYEVISVAGGPGSTVFVGYRGVGIADTDPMWMLKSGDADKVVWNGAGISVSHFDISSPAGVDPHYPQGREKIRTVYRIVYDRKTGNVWFGGDHGVALYEARSNRILEHQHAAINGFKRTRAEDPSWDSYTLLSGDWLGVALDGAGDVWIGGGHRVARIQYSTGGFWALDPGSSWIDVWQDAVAVDARPEERTDDMVNEMLVSGDGSVLVGSLNGLARVGGPRPEYFPSAGWVDSKVTALERDPRNGSLWIGHLWGGVTRIVNGSPQQISLNEVGRELIDGSVWDIQSELRNGQRRILVAFSAGAIGIYTGP
jgi:hypothetical protein